MKIQKTIEVWLVNKRLPKPIDLVQYNTGIQLIFRVKDFTIPSGSTATIYVQKPSGKFVYQTSGITISGDVITMNLENQALAEYGDHIPYQVQIKSGSDTITTFAGMFRVEKSLADAGATESKTVISAFEELTAEQIAEIQATTDALIAQAKQDIELKGADTLASIPEDYTELSALADKAIREKAPGIVCEAVGEHITVVDSSDDYVRGLNLFGKTEQIKTTGKNLLEVTAMSSIINGITYTVNADGTIHANGTATDDSFLTVGTISYAGGKEYRIVGCQSNGGMNTYTLYAVYGDGLYAFDTGNGMTFTPATDITKAVSIKITKGVTVSNILYRPMVMLASVTDSTYEPYTGGKPSPSPEYPQELTSIGNSGSIAVTVAGKNLLYEPYKGQSLTLSTPNGLPGIKLGATIPDVIANSPAHMSGVYWDEETQAYWIGDTIDGVSGKRVQRANQVRVTKQDGIHSVGTYVRCQFQVPRGNNNCSNKAMNTHFPYSGDYEGEFEHAYIWSNLIYWFLPNETASTQEEVNEWLSNNDFRFVYVLETPIETDLSAEEKAAFAALHSNKPYTTVYNDAGAVQKLSYVADTKTYIDNKFAELAAAIVNNA